MTDTRSFGIDVSKYNGPANWEIAKANGVIYAGARATISWGYRDTWFMWHWSGMWDYQIHRLAYHVLYPGENIERQIENFIGCVPPDWLDAVPVLDAELDHGYSRSTITSAITQWLVGVEAGTGKRPIIYSRAGWINAFTNPGAWRSEWDWWLADYLTDRTKEQTTPPILPNGANTYLIHQTADKYPAWTGFNQPSSAGGTPKLDNDTNRWNGDDGAVHAYFNADHHAESINAWAGDIDAWARSIGYNGLYPPE